MKCAIHEQCPCSAERSGHGLVHRQAQPIFAVAWPSCSEGEVASPGLFPDAACEGACGELREPPPNYSCSPRAGHSLCGSLPKKRPVHAELRRETV